MSENNKSYRIRTTVGEDKQVYVKLDQKIDILEILSLKLKQESFYRLHTSGYGVIIGRVLANNGFGIPNAKISVFIQISDDDIKRNEILGIYSYNTTRDKDNNGVRYNLLPDTPINECHKAVGTFPSKTLMLDNDIVLEVFDKYYKYTTKTNESGDYMIFGVPTGSQTVHVDLDLSDIGILSQRPRDFVYKGYTIQQFENPNQFKSDTELSSLSQIFSQESTVDVIPFWGDENEGMIGISRNDIDINFKFEPTCVFIGSVVSDNSSNGFSKKCVPTNAMGNMDELVTGNGTVEMIRKKPDGSVEEFQIQGNQLINGDGVWCYQIPMNLDYMKTDEYGNMVPTDNPERGIPTRARVRFRVSMQDSEQNVSNYFRGKFLVPHNPETKEELDYSFGTATLDSSYRDLFWNGVYTVKSYIPRIQKARWFRTERFSGIKHCNIHGNNNPIPYNNIRIRLPFMFVILCALIKAYVFIISAINTFFSIIPGLGGWGGTDRKCIQVGDSLCPDLEGWYFAPGCSTKLRHTLRIDFAYGFSTGTYADKGWWDKIKAFFSFGNWIYIISYTMLQNTYNQIKNDKGIVTDVDDASQISNTTDTTSVDYKNRAPEDSSVCLTKHTDYLLQCIEINLAQEYKVIQFDFYNDWINGLIYIPRWMRHVRRKFTFLFGLFTIPSKIKGCMTDTTIFDRTRYLTQQCSLSYSYNSSGNGYTKLSTSQTSGCHPSKKDKQKCHTKHGINRVKVFGGNGGLVNQTQTLNKKQYVYYFKPCDWIDGKKCNFFATDICLLGSLNDCDLFGIPQAFKSLSSSSYQMPTNLALTNLEEDGYMYSQNDNGTICSPNNSYSSDERVTQAEDSFSGASKHNPEYTYSDNDDAVPLTESAGIDWGYTGPGQGVAKFDGTNIYQPGGHFLGLSCSQAETNIKSCINLSRICEHGVGMSQRVMIPKSYDEKTDTWHYTNVMPNGFISQDEIYDHDFRAMFATMNYNGLKTIRDEKTGYLKYDFIPSIPTNFDGRFTTYGQKYTTTYNNSSSNKIKVDSINVNKNTSSHETEDATNALVRSLETTSIDYYRFRFGITGDTSATNDKKYFMINNGASVSMPVYRNSFYFYFGLKDGATALDEFNKQFFSTCKNDQNNVNNITLSTAQYTIEGKNKSEYSIQDFLNDKVEAVIKIKGGVMPYDIDVFDINGNDITSTLGIASDNNYVNSINIPLKPDNLSKIRVRVTDNEENSVTQEYDFTIESLFSLNLTSYNYFIPIEKIKTINSNERKNNCDVYGGYIEWDGNISMMGTLQENNFEVLGDGLSIGTTYDKTIAYYPTTEESGDYIIKLKLHNETNNKDYIYDYKIFTISDAIKMDYWVGSDKFNFDKNLENKDLQHWYENLSGLDKWEFKHCFTRQSRTKGLDINSKIINKTTYALSDIAGIPEKIEAITSGTTEIKGEIFHDGSILELASQPSHYEGYDVGLNQIYRPTHPQVNDKNGYQYIVYDTKGQYALGEQMANNLSTLTVDVENRQIRLNGYTGTLLVKGLRYLVINKFMSVLPYALFSNGTILYVDDETVDMEDLKANIEGIPTQIFGFHVFPVYYKPFYFRVFAYTASNSYLREIGTRIKGHLYNGISYQGKLNSMVWNGTDITNNIPTLDESQELSATERVIDISNCLSIDSTDIYDGKLSLSCVDGGPTDDETYKQRLASREANLAFLFREDISINKNEETNLLTVSVKGDTEGVNYFAINADLYDANGNTNILSFPCEGSDGSVWSWVNSSSWFSTDKVIADSDGATYGDFMTYDGLLYLSQHPTDDIPLLFKGAKVEDVTNKMGNGATLILRNANSYTNAYIVGVATDTNEEGASITALYFYNKFQATSIFGGDYDFKIPTYDLAEGKLKFSVLVSGTDTWTKITAEGVKITGQISGRVSYTDTNIWGNEVNETATFNKENIKLVSKTTTENGGELLFEYSGKYVDYNSFTMIGNTTITISGNVISGTDEHGNNVITKVEEDFSSKEPWSVTAQNKLNPQDYVWNMKVYADKENDTTLKLTIDAEPQYPVMTGGVNNRLVFEFKFNDGTERSETITLNKNSTTVSRSINVNIANLVGDITGEIIDNPNSKMYVYEGQVIPNYK